MFSKLNLSPSTFTSLQQLGFVNQTPVQQSAIPILLQQKDACVSACTGSGKTLCYIILILERLLKFNRTAQSTLSAVVIVPTKIIAQQVFDVFQPFAQITEGQIKPFLGVSTKGKVKGLYSHLIQDMSRNTSHYVLITTHGCLSRFVFTDKMDLSSIQILILDEADRLLDPTCLTNLSRIVELMPKNRQTVLFSATMTADANQLSKIGLTKYENIRVNSNHSLDEQMLSSNSTTQTITKETKKNSELFAKKGGYTSSSPSLQQQIQEQPSLVPQSLQNYYSIINPKDKLSFLC